MKLLSIERLTALNSSNENGFTIIELIVVMVILVLLGITGISTYRLLYVKTDLNKLAQEISIDLSSVRLESVAARNGVAYGIRFYPDHYELVSGSPPTPYQTRTLPNDVTVGPISLASTTENRVMFDKLTGFTNNYGSVTLSRSGQSAIITITPQGVISIDQ